MPRIHVSTSAEVEEGSTVEAVDRLVKNPRKLLDVIGLMAVAHSQLAFEEQRLGDEVWAPRMNPNVPGIIKDVNDGNAPRPQRFTDRPALVDEGNLQSDVAHEVISNEEVEIGSTHPAAAIHLLGLPSDMPQITEMGQKRLWQWMKTQGMGRAGRIIQQTAAAKQRAGKAYTRKQKGVWKRAKRELMTEEMGKDPEVAWALRRMERLKRDYGSVKEMKKSSPSVYENEWKPASKIVRKAREKAQEKLGFAEGIGSQHWRAKVENMRTGLREDRDTAVSAAQERRQERLQQVKDRQASNPRFEAAQSLGWLLNPEMVGASKKVKHPARPFLGVPPALRDEVERYLGVVIGEAR